uniref:Farnesoic acid O-methyl transferase domain-containing protein n=1 Tax=Anopheles atroparvus TaxID=41427 RepID=A0AAG5DB79_ANOAO
MAGYSLLPIVTIVLLVHSGQSVLHENSFDAIKGCLQFDNVPGYDDVQVYFPTSLFRNMERTPTSRVFRMGVVGKNDGHIRFGSSAFPYGDTVVEIVLSGWANTKSAGRLQ